MMRWRTHTIVRIHFTGDEIVATSKLDAPGLIATARGLGMNEQAFQSCLDSGEFNSKIDAVFF